MIYNNEKRMNNQGEAGVNYGTVSKNTIKLWFSVKMRRYRYHMI